MRIVLPCSIELFLVYNIRGKTVTWWKNRRIADELFDSETMH